jgi:uncharacterized protein
MKRPASLARRIAKGAAVLTVIGAITSAAVAGPPIVPLPGTGQLQVKVTTFADLRFKNMVRQSRDLSCGAAVVATLLNNAYGFPVSELEIIEAILDNAPDETRAKIATEGFSLLELKRFMETKGFVAGGYKLSSVEKLKNLQVPVIALVNVRGYNHFVVIKKVQNGRVFVADPAFGNSSPPLEKFARQWNGVILAIVLQNAAPNPTFMEDPTIRARPADLRSITNALGGAELIQPGEY